MENIKIETNIKKYINYIEKDAMRGLNYLFISNIDGKISLMATNSYIMLVETFVIEDLPDFKPFAISLEDIKTIIKLENKITTLELDIENKKLIAGSLHLEIFNVTVPDYMQILDYTTGKKPESVNIDLMLLKKAITNIPKDIEKSVTDYQIHIIGENKPLYLAKDNIIIVVMSCRT